MDGTPWGRRGRFAVQWRRALIGRSLRQTAPRLLALAAGCSLLSAALAQGTAGLPLRPAGIAYDAAGNLYFADTNRNEVFEASLAGGLIVVAGNGTQGFGGDGGLATAAMLDAPQSVAIGADGTLYIADTGNQRVRAVASGLIRTFAGTGIVGFAGDGEAAAAASFRGPLGLAVDATGALLVCDGGNQRVRRISGGLLSTIVGNGVQGFGGDGGLAVSAELDSPAGVAVASDGRLFVADMHNQRIRVVGLDGVIETFAGNGQMGFAGDGGPAVAAELASPRGLVVAPDGSLLIADSNNQRIRRVDTTGVITSVAGAGVEGAAADGLAATAASLDSPRAVGVSSFGSAVFVDTENRLVKVLTGNGDLYAPAGMAAGRSTTVILTVGSTAPYGQVEATVNVSGVAVPQGVVQLLDAGAVVAQGTLSAGLVVFSTLSLAVGSHPLSAAYAGDGVNPAAVSGVSAVSVMQAASVASMGAVSQTSYAGLPLALTAQVTPSTTGVPTGTVNFVEGANALATGLLVHGAVAATWLSPTAGTHTIAASYGGDANFAASVSPAVTVVVNPIPDFAVSPQGASSQTVVGGAVASYLLAVAGQQGSFSGAVSMSVNGLPVGATASFSPPQVVPGAGTSSVTLIVQTVATHAALRIRAVWIWALALPILVRRRRRVPQVCLGIILSAGLVNLMGCGARSVADSIGQGTSYSVTVTGTSTNLLGTVVTHSTQLTLVVE